MKYVKVSIKNINYLKVNVKLVVVATFNGKAPLNAVHKVNVVEMMLRNVININMKRIGFLYTFNILFFLVNVSSVKYLNLVL